ncbi:MAG: DUF2797 domain-containing protein [Bacteroidales bacterium]|nr:DUF2797 domain-containing protein [Bacteroidales bacterium]
MKISGNIRKMLTQLDNPVQYALPLNNNLERAECVEMNQFIGKKIKISFENQINCVVTGKQIKKAYGEGMSYDAFRSSPFAVESIIRPELSRAHEGIGLRDLEWEIKHDIQPHIVYIALTSSMKVGVTRKTQVPTRWIDQGAWKALPIAETPYRQAAGLIEVALKNHISDKTNWRKMLTNQMDWEKDIITVKDELLSYIPENLQEFTKTDEHITEIQYPVQKYPTKVSSMKLDKTPIIEGILNGIRGQYLLFDNNRVINIRSHSGYSISLEA